MTRWNHSRGNFPAKRGWRFEFILNVHPEYFNIFYSIYIALRLYMKNSARVVLGQIQTIHFHLLVAFTMMSIQSVHVVICSPWQQQLCHGHNMVLHWLQQQQQQQVLLWRTRQQQYYGVRGITRSKYYCTTEYAAAGGRTCGRPSPTVFFREPTVAIPSTQHRMQHEDPMHFVIQKQRAKQEHDQGWKALLQHHLHLS